MKITKTKVRAWTKWIEVPIPMITICKVRIPESDKDWEMWEYIGTIIWELQFPFPHLQYFGYLIRRWEGFLWPHNGMLSWERPYLDHLNWVRSAYGLKPIVDLIPF